MRRFVGAVVVSLSLLKGISYGQKTIDCTTTEKNEIQNNNAICSIIDCALVDKNAATCSEVWQHGERFTIIKNNGVSIVASAVHDLSKNLFFQWVGVINHTSQNVDVAPEFFTAYLTDGIVVPVANPDQALANKLRHDTLMNSLFSFADRAINGDQKAFVTDANGSQAITYSTSLQDAEQNARQDALNKTYQAGTGSALRHTTLMQEGRLVGVVYFERPKNAYKHAYPAKTILHLGDCTYVF
jgi:hypothetical protein